jgi:ribosome biogenesis protein Tsr3
MSAAVLHILVCKWRVYGKQDVNPYLYARIRFNRNERKLKPVLVAQNPVNEGLDLLLLLLFTRNYF